MSAKKIEKYAVVLVGMWVVFVGTFVFAIFRVSNSDKFNGLHLNSWTLDGKKPTKTAK
ncbi:MAG TPA: hypothetical protein VK184_20850 [Nostocaceae cyanobacterium]|nr:hypothetical protein [Nostocaceae cyanobacterium]